LFLLNVFPGLAQLLFGNDLRFGARVELFRHRPLTWWRCPPPSQAKLAWPKAAEYSAKVLDSYVVLLTVFCPAASFTSDGDGVPPRTARKGLMTPTANMAVGICPPQGGFSLP